jgi:DNA-binding transcriptional MerR regulator
MRIGDVAQATGISRDTLRFYEKRGLLRARRHANGYRDYPPEAVQWLTYIRTAQALGFTLAEIEADLPLLADPAASGDAIRGALRDKLAEIDRRIAGLATLRSELQRRLQETPDDCPLRPVPQAASASSTAA